MRMIASFATDTFKIRALPISQYRKTSSRRALPRCHRMSLQQAFSSERHRVEISHTTGLRHLFAPTLCKLQVVYIQFLFRFATEAVFAFSSFAYSFQ
mmetsp:Transcript_75598/g.202402  ORF Transcript_75598/g.202402 Transcript_75598/m.202402 type:complete len:97 (-) Transcript_75598:28-318(-)